MSRCELPLAQPGQCILFVDLSEVKSRSVSETLNFLEQMGYEPQLRYLEPEDGKVYLFALLKFEQLDPTQRIPDDYLMDEIAALWQAFPGENSAVRCSRGVPVEASVAV